jgi:polyhydroxybutyrate depolymerase
MEDQGLTKMSSRIGSQQAARTIAIAACVMTTVLAACSSDDETRATAAIAPSKPEPARPDPRVTPPAAAADASVPETSDAESKPKPGVVVTSETLDVAGKSRSFLLVAPSTYSPSKSYPLVLVLHGDGGDGSSIRAAIPVDGASDQDAIVAYPSGNLGWNLYDAPDTNDDLTFLVALVASLQTRFTLDPARVFGVGFSSGAFMLNQVACRRPSFFRAIAPHSGGAPNEPRDPAATRWENDYTRCAGQTMGSGPAVMVIHGTADTDVSYASGDFTADYWAYVDGCQTTRSPAAPSPCVAHDACPQGKPVIFCAVPDLTHAVWPQAATTAWQFFRNL